MVLTVLDVCVTLFGVAMAAAPLLQLLRMMRLRASEEVSLGMLGVLLLGGVLWTAYGLAHHQVALIICNAIGTGCSASTLLVAWWLRARER